MLEPKFATKKCSPEEFVKKSVSCSKHTDFIDKNYLEIAKFKKNITVGFGFVSHNNGLSMGVPIDIYTMLLTAEDARRQVIEEGAKVHVLIGDHFAFESHHQSCEDISKVRKIRDKYIKKIKHILINLGVEQHYVFHLSSEIIISEAYKSLRAELEEQVEKINDFVQVDIEPKEMISKKGKHIISTDTWEILNPTLYSRYDQSNRKYFLDQTAIFRYMFEKQGCGIKVSWAKAHQSSKISRSVSFDEPHFDRFYRDLYFDHEARLSFIYTKPGFATNRTDERSKVIPYTAAPQEDIHRVLLSSKQPLSKDGKVNPEFLHSIEMNAKFLKECQSEVVSCVISKETDIDAFYKNVTFLRLFSKSPSKHLAISFTDKLQIEPVDKSKEPSNATEKNKF